MQQAKQLIVTLLCTALIGCGGGGGSEEGACSTLKINGGESCEGPVPTVALLLIQDRNAKSTASCTGALISETAVLTAAHCLTNRPSKIEVVVPGHQRTASRYAIHPLYRNTQSGFDIAVVNFSEPIKGGQAAILVSSTAPAEGDKLVVYGYGLDENRNDARQRIESGEAALKASDLTFKQNLGDMFYKAVSDGSGNVCKGDSGGPVLARNSEGQWGIVAVTSFSKEVNEDVYCVPIEPGAEAVMSPTQNTLAMEFIMTIVPDAALN